MEGWPSAALSWFKCISRTTEGAHGEHSWGGAPCPGPTAWTLTYPTPPPCASFTQLNLPAKSWARRTAPVLLAAFNSLLGDHLAMVPQWHSLGVGQATYPMTEPFSNAHTLFTAHGMTWRQNELLPLCLGIQSCWAQVMKWVGEKEAVTLKSTVVYLITVEFMWGLSVCLNSNTFLNMPAKDSNSKRQCFCFFN